MKLPRLTFAQVDWAAAIAALADTERLAPIAARRRPQAAKPAVSPALARINTMLAQRFTGLAQSAVPVLLPFDVEAFSRDLASDAGPGDDERYLSGFSAARFFYPGAAGYDAAFAIRTADIPELAEIKFAQPIEVQISGSRIVYELDPPIAQGTPVAALDAEFPGIRRLMIEHNLRYTFTRFGVPYVVSIACFDAGVSRFKMPTCMAADRVAQRFLRALRFVGGAPLRMATDSPLPTSRPARVSRNFGYYMPGQLLGGSGFRGQSGRQDYTVYSQIRFPLGEGPAYANSEVFQNRNRMRVSNLEDFPSLSYSWRDNFCERRGFPVSQCPAGIGHQGQDIRPAGCKLIPGTERCEQHGDVLAVRDGMILRNARQEAAYLFVNTANEHVRFRYLHMSPRRMDADNLLSGRRVSEGEVIGEVSNFSMKAAGTSYHLHFDVQVPTRQGWIYVNPYMTLVAAYEQLIGTRGTELADPVLADGETASSGLARAETKKSRRHYIKRARHKPKAAKHRVRQAQR